MALRRLGLRDWTVVWNPGGSEEERGAAYPDTKLIVVYDREREAALTTLIHEFLEVKMKAVIRPQLATINALLKALEKIYYSEKEETIEDLTPLLLRVLKEDFTKKEEEAVTAPV
ncbi:unnamed protein product [marine sediment metagenome]|uniref:Uncharacterized protein n=1 Tax=marine sediment metagenome TaxID=412755 RepID=X1SRM8_9ZZZZ